MMILELREQERDPLVRLLTSARTETCAGIHHAMDHETRETLRAVGEPAEVVR